MRNIAAGWFIVAECKKMNSKAGVRSIRVCNSREVGSRASDRYDVTTNHLHRRLTSSSVGPIGKQYPPSTSMLRSTFHLTDAARVYVTYRQSHKRHVSCASNRTWQYRVVIYAGFRKKLENCHATLPPNGVYLERRSAEPF